MSYRWYTSYYKNLENLMLGIHEACERYVFIPLRCLPLSKAAGIHTSSSFEPI